MNRIYSYILTVEGRGEFPLDMLRYEQAYPATERDSYRITERGKRQIELAIQTTRFFTPTGGRWESFGWKVVSCEGDY